MILNEFLPPNGMHIFAIKFIVGFPSIKPVWQRFILTIRLNSAKGRKTNNVSFE